MNEWKKMWNSQHVRQGLWLLVMGLFPNLPFSIRLLTYHPEYVRFKEVTTSILSSTPLLVEKQRTIKHYIKCKVTCKIHPVKTSPKISTTPSLIWKSATRDIFSQWIFKLWFSQNVETPGKKKCLYYMWFPHLGQDWMA